MAIPANAASSAPASLALVLADVTDILDAKKAADIVTIDLRGKTDIADAMVVASGTSGTHNQALADHVEKTLRARGVAVLSVEGKTPGDWILIDTPELVVHIFRPETRHYYGLEKMWLADFADVGGDAWALEEADNGLRIYRTK